jgi:hypothetical protein
MPGLFFEDFHEGQTFDHALSRTVTEMDNVLFSTLTLNPSHCIWTKNSHGRRNSASASSIRCSPWD